MKTQFKKFHAGLLLASLLALSLVSRAAGPAQAAPTPTPDATLHEIGASQAPAAAPAAIAPATGAAPAASAAPAAAEAPTAAPTPKAHHHNDSDDRVAVMGATYVGLNEVIDGSAVAVMGPVTVDGTVNENAVAVMGNNTINGTVHGDAVAVLGDLKLGPNAAVDGNVVAVGGHVIRDATASVGGKIVEKGIGSDFSGNPHISEFLDHAVKMGRPLALGAHLLWIWVITVCVTAFYVLLALIFPNGVRKCGDTLVQRPGTTFLVGFLAVLGLPVLFILLLVTIVGIPVAIVVLPLSVMACILFGKASVYALIGRSVAGKQMHPALAVLIGVAICVLFYFVPFLGGALALLITFVGFACALTTLFLSGKSAPAPAVPPAAPPAPLPAAAPVVPAAPDAAPAPPALQAPLAAEAPPLVSSAPAPAPQSPPALSRLAEAGLPRAGFWIRMVALLIDAILVGIVTRMHGLFLPALALYGALLWKFRGATIGGIIFGLKVVRQDGREMDWTTSIVRALACFLSLIVVGLGFIWIGFDPEKQAWHDKIAGTVVVRLPKGASLV